MSTRRSRRFRPCVDRPAPGKDNGIEDDKRPSLFSRITRYPPRPRWSPREDSLTESLVAILDLIDGLADTLASHWGIEPRSGGWAVSSQELTGGKRLDRVDLQMEGDGALIWIEIKHRSELSRGQLERYRAALGALPDRKLVLLAPEEFDFDAAEAQHAHECSTWQEIGSLLHRHGEQSDLAGTEKWLLDEFVKFLTEEDLLVIEAFSDTHLDAVLHRSEATKSLQDLLRQAQMKIKAERGDPNDTWPPNWPKAGVNNSWPKFWAVWSEPDYGETARFEWLLNTEVEGQLQFGAGLTVDDGHAETSPLGDEKWWKPLVDQQGFEEPCLINGNWWRLFKRKDPSTLVSASPSRDEQIRDLSGWVIDTFAALDESRPRV
jgi:hypothetical protein